MASRTALTVAAVVATGVLAYAVYFDYKRRNDIEFRRKLSAYSPAFIEPRHVLTGPTEKERKRVNKNVEQTQKEETAPASVDTDTLREALKALKTEPPVPMEERENYFMSQISMGEQLAAQGASPTRVSVL
jgi:import receptor subunit TOM20